MNDHDADKDVPRLRHKCLTLIDGNPCEARPPHAQSECWAVTMTGRTVRVIPLAVGEESEG